MKNQKIDENFLLKIIQNVKTPEENELFQTWLNESDENKSKYSEYRKLWKDVSEFPVEENLGKEDQWNVIYKAISETRESEQRKTPHSNSHSDYRSIRKRNYASGGWLFKAAAVLIIALLSYQLYDWNSESSVVPQNKPELQYYTRVAEKGEKAVVKLGDGTIVYLNTASEIRYPKYFEKYERRIEFTGEAYFEVASDAMRPFRVYVGNTVTEVVGTEFNIYNRNNDFRIVVTQGKVKTYIKESEEKIDLVKGEMLEFSDSVGFSIPKSIDVKDYLSWRENKMAFSDTPLAKVLEEIEINFNVNSVIKNKTLKNKKLTGTFNTNSLHEILTAISISMNIDIERNGNTIIVF
jgi:transmembrane sensor